MIETVPNETTTAPQPLRNPTAGIPLRARATLETRRKMRWDYVQGKASVLELTRQYGVAESTGKRWSLAEDWPRLRADFNAREIAGYTPAPLPAPTPAPVLTPAQARVDRIEKQLEAIEQQMEGVTNAGTLRDLSAAHKLLFECYCTLAGIQKPGTARRSKRNTPPQVSTAPREPDEQAPPVVPAGSWNPPDGYIQSQAAGNQ